VFSHYFARRLLPGISDPRCRAEPRTWAPRPPPLLSAPSPLSFSFFLPCSGRRGPRRRREGLVSIFFFLVCVCVFVCVCGRGARAGGQPAGTPRHGTSHGWPNAGPWTPQKAAIAVTARPGETLPGRARGWRGRWRWGWPDPSALACFVVGLRQGRQWEAPVFYPVPAQTPTEEEERVHLGRRGHH
jgi:hypothetical protein